ncbi:MAG: DUF2723 domain-containing protein [Rhodothermales bacterium]|nr:DUF2723 domain-containing protein [Rhodothermales bacterium]
MNWNRVEKIVAAVVFAYAFIIYALTVAPTTSFWDSGEFIAIANRLQVSHPPGAPFYMLIGRFISMFVPAAYVALSVNMVSVLASAMTVVLTHLIIVQLVRIWQESEEDQGQNTGSTVIALIGGVIGACTFTVTDSFWFNAVEAEVYGLSMLFTAVVVWLILRWRVLARREEMLLAGGHHPFGLTANRYLVLIAYMFGLAIGVHLLNLLAVFFIALIVYYNEFEKEDQDLSKTITGITLTGLVASVAFGMVYPGVIQILPDVAGKSGSPLLFVFVIVGLLVFSIYYTQRRKLPALNIIAVCLAMVLIGYSTYALIFIRSAADPPIDENDPETTEAIVSYLKREQYGATPLLSGNTFDNSTGQVNLNDETSFPRRHSQDPAHWRVYRNYDSDLDFFWQYQIGHMYFRYFGWNFIGRASDVQDAPSIIGLPGEAPYFFQTPSEEASRNAYYGLPLLLGLFGFLYHVRKDWRRAFAVGILFFVSGIGIILYLNQTPNQPRERDYAYVASFFAFSLWIGIGASGIAEMIFGDKRDWEARKTAVIAAAAAAFVLVPGLMLVVNYDDHDRSGRYVAPDYAYNMLSSVAEDGILFTNGDNDTFPLWYLQEVEQVRQDVRVANLSLLNTPWYVRQLKYQASRDSEPLPISMPDDNIETLSISRWDPREIQLPVNKNKIVSELLHTTADSSKILDRMVWRLEGRPYPFSEEFNLLYAADQVVLDILVTNARNDWERPVYFAVTVSPSGQLDTQEFFQMEGQAFRVVPIKNEDGGLGRIDPELVASRLLNFRFRGIDDPDVYFDDNIRNMLDNYRNVYSHAATVSARKGRPDIARELLDTIMTNVPLETIPADERSYLLLSRGYQEIGEMETAVEIMRKSEPIVINLLESSSTRNELNYAIPFAQYLRSIYLETGDFEAAADFTNRLADVVDDPSLRSSAEEMRQEYERQEPPDTSGSE